MVNLGRLEVGGDEDIGGQTQRGGGRGRGTGEVAGRGAREGFHAELHGSGGRDRDGAVLEAEGRVPGVVLDPEPIHAQRRRQPVGSEERRGADRKPA